MTLLNFRSTLDKVDLPSATSKKVGAAEAEVEVQAIVQEGQLSVIQPRK